MYMIQTTATQFQLRLWIAYNKQTCLILGQICSSLPGTNLLQQDTCTTNLPTPKYFCQYSEQPMSVLSKFWQEFCGCNTDQSKQNGVKSKFFYHSSCKNNVWTHIFNYTDALHSDDFILFTSVKVVLIEDHRTLFPRIMHSVCCFC